MRNSSRLKYVRSESFLHSKRTYVLFLLVHVPDGFFLSASAALSTYSAAKSLRISSISIYAGLFVPGHTAHSRSFGVFCTIGSRRFCRLAAMMRRSARREEAYVPTSQLRRFTLPDSAPIMRRVMGFLSDQARTLIHAGVSRDRICIDPGPGFGKSANEDIVIQRETAKMASLGYPLMCAVSRKRFVGAVSGVTEAAERDAATFGVCLGAIQAGANIVRVHDAAGFAQFLNGYWAVAKPQPRRAFVAVGSNLGHRCDNIRAAREMIAEIPLTCVSNSSKIYESEPAYETRQDAFANAVIEIKTELAPLVLLDELMKIEAELGRDRSKKAKANGPRTIDLDLLWMDGETHGGKKLRLPHPLIGERDFVLVPLEDLMHDPARFFRYNGVEVKEPEDRVGHIVGELGRM